MEKTKIIELLDEITTPKFKKLTQKEISDLRKKRIKYNNKIKRQKKQKREKEKREKIITFRNWKKIKA